MVSGGYKEGWLQPSSLAELNQRMHGRIPVDELATRAASRRDIFFERLFPYARPFEGARALELGPGVGWIMQAMLDRYPISQLVGLDISPVMIERSKERWADSRTNFVLYDGLRIPLEGDSFDNVYSVECIQHIEKHHAFLVMKELLRVLKPGGHATLHLMSVHNLSKNRRSYEQECWNHVNSASAQWMHYYTYDEIYVLFSEALGVTDLDIKFLETSFWVHFSKGTGRRYASPDVAAEYFVNRPVPKTIRPPRSRAKKS